jgi:hypothetical protein
MDAALDAAASRLARDMPLVLHGSGDVPAPRVLPSTAQTMAALTARYVSSLVDAALDAQRMFCGDDGAAAAAALPPPSLPRRRDPPAPPPPPAAAAVVPPAIGRRRRRAGDEFWDEPLVPRIRKKSPAPETPAIAAAAAAAKDSASNRFPPPPPRPAPSPPPEDAWVGAAGVDLLGPGRVRPAYVRGPRALSTQSFVFPVCHDAYAYNRVLDAQSAKRGLQSALADPVVAELVRTEGRPPRKKKRKPLRRKKRGGSAEGDENEDNDDEAEDDDDEEEDEDATDGPSWPGLEAILPVHRGGYGSLFGAPDGPDDDAL